MYPSPAAQAIERTTVLSISLMYMLRLGKFFWGVGKLVPPARNHFDASVSREFRSHRYARTWRGQSPSANLFSAHPSTLLFSLVECLSCYFYIYIFFRSQHHIKASAWLQQQEQAGFGRKDKPTDSSSQAQAPRRQSQAGSSFCLKQRQRQREVYGGALEHNLKTSLTCKT